MERKNKKYYYILIALLLLIPFKMVNAMYQGQTQMYKSDDGLPYYIMTNNLTHEGQINIEWVNGSGEAYTASSVDFMKMEANGKLAFCADFTKSYGYNTCYSLYGYYAANTFVGQLYDYGTKNNGENYKIAQVIWWALRKTNYMQKFVPGTGGGGGGELKLMNEHPTEPQFVELLKQAFKNAGLSNGNTSASGELFKLPGHSYCDCVWKDDCPDDAHRTLFTGDNSVLMVIDSGGQYYYPSNYMLAGTDSIYYQVCKEVSDAADKDEKWEYWRHILNGEQEVEKDNSLLGYDISAIYREITGSAGKKVGAYTPVKCKDGSALTDIQNIYAPVDDMEPKSCVNYLGAIKTLNPDKSAQWIYDNYNDIIKKATGTNLYLTADKTGVYCKDMDKKCAEVRRKWNYIRVLNPGKNPKFGNAWIYIPNGSEDYIDSPITCACSDERDKFNSRKPGEQYQGTCASFKEWYQKWKADLAKVGITIADDIVCESPTKAACTGTTTTHPTCEELVETRNYKNYNTCAELKRDITNPEKVTTCNDSTGIVSLLRCGEKCTPNLDIETAGCYDKGEGGNGIVKMSDAIDNKKDPDYTTCISNNIGYSIEGKDIGSLYDEVKYKNNSYCKIYCWESLELYLPQEPQPKGYLKPIQAGREFWWGVNSSSFATMETKKICWAKDIKYSQFESDWANNESDILQKYANYQAQVKYNEQTDVKKGSDCCVGNKTHKEKGTSCSSPYRYSNGKCIHNKQPGEGCHPGASEINATTCEGPSPDEIDVCDDDAKGNEYYLDEASYTYGGKTGKSNQVKKCATSAPSASDLHDSGEESKRKDAVQSAINERTKIYKAIRSCQSDELVNASTIYTYGTEITINDNSDLNLSGKGVKTYKLVRNDYGSLDPSESVLNGRTSVLACNSIPDGFSAPTNDPCKGGSSYEVQNYSTYKWNYNGGSNFNYPSSFSFIASMESDTIYSIETVPATEELARLLGLTFDAGMGIPTYINKAKGKFKIDVSIKNLGSMKDGKAHFEDLTKDQKLYDFNIEKYGCSYDLANVIYCPPGTGDPDCPGGGSGISIVYRIIEMASGDKAKVFPGREGNDGSTSRRIGSNWASFVYNEKFKKITSTGEIYGKDPLYSIELTPTLISEIRRNNNSYRNSSLDPYTSFRDLNNNFKIECTHDNGELKSCTSNYITDLIKRGKMILEYK